MDASEAPKGTTTSADREYFERLGRGEFSIPRCEDCSRAIFFPRVVCPHCGSERLMWFRPTGMGTVYSTTTVRGRKDAYNVCLVDLDEGVRLMSRVVGIESGLVKIGDRVRAKIVTDDEKPLLVFEAAQ